MANTQPPRNPNLKSNVRIRTIIAVAAFTLGAFGLLIYQLYALQLRDAEHYRTEAVTQQLQDTELPATRGNIYSANGKLLAKSNTVWNIIADPAQSEKNGATETEIRTAAEHIAELLNDGTSADDIYAKLTARNKNGELYQYRVVAQNVEKPVADAIIEYSKSYRTAPKKEGETGYRIVVLSTEQSTTRSYPYGAFASSVIGFCNNDENGKLVGAYGLEKSYEEDLAGTPGRSIAETNVNGEILANTEADVHDAIDGNNLNLTLDENVQAIVEEYLAEAMETFSVHGRGSAIVMNVKTGEILGMASLGDFDLNDYQTVSAADQEAIDAEEDEEKKSEMLTAAQQKQWRNKTISDTYEPGSTFKIITLAMALEEGVINKNDSFYCGGSLDVLGRTEPVHCWKTYGHGAQTLTQAIQHSCNIALVNIGQKVGAEKFYEYAEAFGFFEYYGDSSAQLTGKTGIDLGGEAGSIWWSKDVFTDKTNLSQLCSASFGQTFNITPIQLITAVSACANGGHLMKPYLVKEIIGEDGTTIQKNEILEQVVCDPKEGTGKNAYVAGYRIGGKTGTSTNTTVEATTGRKQYIVSFIGIAPADDPQYAVLVMLDSPSSESGIYVSGGQMAAPTAGKIFADILPYLGVEPEYTDSEAQNTDKRVPNVKGMTIEEAKAAIQAEGLTCRVIGDGSEVTQQLPRANVVIASSSEVLLYAGAEPSEEKEEVPDLTGLSYSIARQRLGALGLYISSTNGSASESSTVVISRQNIEAGTEVKHGTVITVTLVDNDASIYGRY